MAANISRFYRQAAINLMSLNITDTEMYVLIPSENDEQTYYRVDLNEETLEPVKCGCKGFCRWNRCKHFTIVSECFAGYVAPIAPVTEPVEPKITEVETGSWYIINASTSVFKTEEGEWIALGPTTDAIEIVKAHLEKQMAVAEAEKIITQPKVEAPVVPQYTNMFKKPWNKIAEAREQRENYREILSEARAIRERRARDLGEVGNFGSKAFSII